MTITKIKLMRMMRGMTQQELANCIGISEAYICKIETGRVWPKKHIKRIAEALCVTEDEISGTVDGLAKAL